VRNLFIIYKKYRSFCPVKQPENASRTKFRRAPSKNFVTFVRHCFVR